MKSGLDEAFDYSATGWLVREQRDTGMMGADCQRPEYVNCRSSVPHILAVVLWLRLVGACVHGGDAFA